jgi:GT2 family glycosyltransferase
MIDNPSVSIVIPFYNEWQLTHQRLMDLYKFAPEDCEIVLVDDASIELECGNGISWWQKADFKRHNIRYYKNPENVGFGQSNNNGAKLARGEYLIFLSNDVVIYDDFVTDMVTLMHNDNKILIAGRIVDWAGGWNEFNIDGNHYVIPYAEGWLLGCTKIAWKGLGGFDPIYGKFDYEDVDLSTKALSLGYNIVGLNSNKLKHLGSQTISKLNINRQLITEHNREIFIEKWNSIIPTLSLLVK